LADQARLRPKQQRLELKLEMDRESDSFDPSSKSLLTHNVLRQKTLTLAMFGPHATPDCVHTSADAISQRGNSLTHFPHASPDFFLLHIFLLNFYGQLECE